MAAAYTLCSPHTKLADLSVAAVNFNKWGQPSHRGIFWEVQLVKNTWGHGQMSDPKFFFMSHWEELHIWLGYIMMMPSARSSEQLCEDIGVATRCGYTCNEVLEVTKSRRNHPNLLVKRSALKKRTGLLTLIIKAQASRGLVTESSSDSRN